MKLRIFVLILNLFVCFNFVVQAMNVEVQNDNLIKLDLPSINRIMELSEAFENKSTRVRYLRNSAISLAFLSAVSFAAYKIYENKFRSLDSSCGDGVSETTRSSEDRREYTESNYRWEKFQDRRAKRTISFWGKEAIRKGIYFGGITSLVGIIATSTELTGQLVKNFLCDLIEYGSMQNTFLTLKEAIPFYLNWMAELLNDLNDTEIKKASFFTSYSGLIDGVFVLVHGLESFLALVLSRSRIEFGVGSLKYRSIVLEQKQVLDKTNIFMSSLQKDMEVWDEQGICDISDETFKHLRSLTAKVLKFSQNMQLLLYKKSVGIVKSSGI